MENEFDSTLSQLEMLSKQEIEFVDEKRLKENINTLNNRIDYLLNYVQQNKDKMSGTQLDDIMKQINELFHTMSEHADARFDSISTKLDDIETSIDELTTSVKDQSKLQISQPSQSPNIPNQPQILHQPQQTSSTITREQIMNNPYVKFYNDYMMLNPEQKELVDKAKRHFKKVNNTPKYHRGALLDVAKKNKNTVGLTLEGLELFKTDIDKYDFPFVDDGSEEAKSWLSFD